MCCPRNVHLAVKPSFSQPLASCQFSFCVNSVRIYVNAALPQWQNSAKTGFILFILTAPEDDCWQASTKNIRLKELQVLPCRFTAAALLLELIWPLEFRIVMWFKCQLRSSAICLRLVSSDYPALRSDLKGFSSDHMVSFTGHHMDGALEVLWDGERTSGHFPWLSPDIRLFFFRV